MRRAAHTNAGALADDSARATRDGNRNARTRDLDRDAHIDTDAIATNRDNDSTNAHTNPRAGRTDCPGSTFADFAPGVQTHRHDCCAYQSGWH